MKRISIFISLFAGLILTGTSCIYYSTGSIAGNGNVVTEVREIPDFKAIAVSNGLEVIITFGEPLSLQVEADENLQDIIRTEVSGGVLKVYSEKNIRKAAEKNVIITVPSLDEIDVSSAGNVKCENILNTDNLHISVSSAGKLRIETVADEINAEASSGGNVELRGTADELEVDVSSAGSIDADRLEVKNCDVSASSAGSASVWVSEELRAEASSAGNIQYKGNPSNRKVDTSSAGSVTQK